jgi:hypothetical protein
MGGTVVPRPDREVENAGFLVASFVRHLQETRHAAALNYLDTVVKGHMLANAIFLPDPGSASRRFRNTEVYFDTPFLLDALGYDGESQQEPCQELLELLNDTGAELRCFDHTRDEVRGVLRQCASLMREDSKQGPVSDPGILKYFVSKGLHPTDVVMMSNNLEGKLGALRIRVVEKPGYEGWHRVDEDALRQELEKGVRYSWERQLSRDVDSISAIMRLREGRTFVHLEECRALFVTTNSGLARATQRFFSDGPDDDSVSPCFTDYALTNLLWLKKPTAAPYLPWKMLIADCYAATRPSEQLWEKFVKEIEPLRERGERETKAYYYLLRYSMEAETALMEATKGGQEELLTQYTVPEILERLREDIEREKTAAIEEERDSREGIAIKLEGKLEGGRKREKRRRERIKSNAQKTAHWLVRAALVILLGLLLFLLSVLNLVFGTTLLSALQRVEAAWALWIERRLLWLIGEE